MVTAVVMRATTADEEWTDTAAAQDETDQDNCPHVFLEPASEALAAPTICINTIKFVKLIFFI